MLTRTRETSSLQMTNGLPCSIWEWLRGCCPAFRTICFAYCWRSARDAGVARFHSPIHRVGAGAQLAVLSRELLLSVRACFHRRPGPRGGLLRRHVGAGGYGDRRRESVGRAGQVLALPGFLARGIRDSARVVRRRSIRILPRRSRSARRVWRGQHPRVRVPDGSSAPSRRDEAGAV